MSNLKLSDRIINECQEFTDRYMKQPVVSKLLLTGDVPNGEQYMARIVQFWWIWKDEFALIFRFALKHAETPEEIAFLKNLDALGSQFVHIYLNRYEELFGEFDKKLLTQPLPLNIWSYKQHYLKEASFGTVIENLILILAMFWPTYQFRALPSKPNFKPNPYFDFILSDGEGTVELIHTIKRLIDNRESLISAEKEQQLIWLLKRSLIYESIYMETVWNKDLSNIY